MTWIRKEALASLARALERMAELQPTEEELDFEDPCCRLKEVVEQYSTWRELVEADGALFWHSQDFSWWEFRLNGSGLKLFYSISPEGDLSAFVRGDQFDHYPVSGPRFNRILEEEGLKSA